MVTNGKPLTATRKQLHVTLPDFASLFPRILHALSRSLEFEALTHRIQTGLSGDPLRCAVFLYSARLSAPRTSVLIFSLAESPGHEHCGDVHRCVNNSRIWIWGVHLHSPSRLGALFPRVGHSDWLRNPGRIRDKVWPYENMGVTVTIKSGSKFGIGRKRKLKRKLHSTELVPGGLSGTFDVVRRSCATAYSYELQLATSWNPPQFNYMSHVRATIFHVILRPWTLST